MYFYYDENNKIYKSRYEAIITPKPCFFYYYDKEMSLIPWTIEPKKSLQQVYKERAESIRSENDYIILCYSGGIDSTNMLETFYYNNIHIDEILTIGALSQDSNKGSDENMNGDIYNNVFPTLNHLHLPNTKITIKDYSEEFKDFYSSSIAKQYGTEWYKNCGSYFSIHNYFWMNIKNVLKIKNEKTAIVFGADKPSLYVKDNKFYYRFNDLSMFDYGGIPLIGNTKRINFYTSHDSTELMRKQFHTLMNIQKEISARGGKWVINDQDIMKKIIYPKMRHPLIFQSSKSKNNIIARRDSFILNKKDSDVYKIYVEGLRNFKKDMKGSLPTLQTNFMSREYYLGDI